jgi:hypothetical protein
MMTIIFFQHVDLDGSQSKLKSLKIQTIDISFFPVSSKAAAGSSSCQLLRSSQRHIQYIKGGGRVETSFVDYAVQRESMYVCQHLGTFEVFVVVFKHKLGSVFIQSGLWKRFD